MPRDEKLFIGINKDLKEKMQFLWNNKEICKSLANEGRKIILQKYTEEKYYKNLIKAYKQAIEHKFSD